MHQFGQQQHVPTRGVDGFGQDWRHLLVLVGFSRFSSKEFSGFGRKSPSLDIYRIPPLKLNCPNRLQTSVKKVVNDWFASNSCKHRQHTSLLAGAAGATGNTHHPHISRLHDSFVCSNKAGSIAHIQAVLFCFQVQATAYPWGKHLN